MLDDVVEIKINIRNDPYDFGNRWFYLKALIYNVPLNKYHYHCMKLLTTEVASSQFSSVIKDNV